MVNQTQKKLPFPNHVKSKEGACGLPTGHAQANEADNSGALTSSILWLPHLQYMASQGARPI